MSDSAGTVIVQAGAFLQARAFDDEWRRWIAENLVLGGTLASILPALVDLGFAADEARREIESAAASPYTSGARRLVNRLKKREWVLEIHRKLNRILPSGGLVERRERPSREVFFRDYYTTNRPVVITGAIDDWPALAKWTPAFLRDRFGQRIVEVQTNRNADPRYEADSHRHRRQMPLAEYIDQLVAGGPTNDYYMTANNSSQNFQTLRELWDDIVQIPEYLDGAADQRGFLWFGPAGTITPLHHDLTNNFMAQVYGRKLVKLVPSCDLAYVANELHCYTDVDAENVDPRRFPQFSQARLIDVVIGPGDVLFLPVGWWHYVRALEVSITVSFTNFAVDNDFHTCYSTYHDVRVGPGRALRIEAMITSLEPSWRDWVVTNLGRNCTHESIVTAMVAKDFDPHFAKAIVALVASELSSQTSPPSANPPSANPPSASLPSANPPSADSASATRPPTDEQAAARPAAPEARLGSAQVVADQPASPRWPRGKANQEFVSEPGRIAPSHLIVADGRPIQVLARLARPDLCLLGDVLSPDECRELIGRSREKLARSTTVDPASGQATVIANRSSFGTFFYNNEDDFIASIDRRLSELLRWPIDHTEGIQILRYEVGGEYRPHFDYFPPDHPGSGGHVSQGGQRIGSLIMYLNDVEEGGETVFPAIGLAVAPRRGQAVYFGYCDSHNQVDPLTLHGGAQVRAGEKWIATKWLRQHRRV